MTVLIAIFVVLFGLALGSFLNVCIARLPEHVSIVHPGSRCPHCEAPIAARDNIPLLSWILLRGRCRTCSARISLRYPLVEAATAGLFLACWLRFGINGAGSIGGIGTSGGINLDAIGRMLLCFLVLGLAVMDWETMQLPDAFTLPGIVLGVLFRGLIGLAGGRGFWPGAGRALLGSAAAALLILALRGLYWLVRRREGMGLGDAKLLAMIAAWLGVWQTLLVMFFAVIAAALYGILLLARARRPNSPDAAPEMAPERASSTGQGAAPSLVPATAATLRLPFGSFLCAAALYAIFWGTETIHWYLRFLN